MQVTITNLADGEKSLLIKSQWADVSDDYDELVGEYVRAGIPGFRPGKVPKRLIEKRFRTDLQDGLARRCGERLVQQSLDERGLQAGAPVSIADVHVEPGQALTFTAKVVPVPPFELPEYGAIPVGADSPDERLDQVCDWLLAETSLTPPDATVRQELTFGDDPNVAQESEAWAAAAQRVKLMLTLRRIAEQEGIEVDERDVDERIAEMAKQTKTPERRLRQQLLQNGGLSRLAGYLLAEQTLAYLLDANAGA
ncbi:MAG: hypothetical protein HN849_28995 [Victivallales bacterium]|jgi:trigger factor|nr:hypothetical protein [Victivallales bacterium]MBT7303601.1 hypothetical protein [Victivallales bacterium]